MLRIGVASHRLCLASSRLERNITTRIEMDEEEACCHCETRREAVCRFGGETWVLEAINESGIAISPDFTHVRSVSIGCGVTE